MTEENLARLKCLGRELMVPSLNGARGMTEEEVLALPSSTVAELERRDAAQTAHLEVIEKLTRGFRC